MDKTKKSRDIREAELERKKRDLYTVYNPTNQDFQVVLNAAISPEIWTIKAHETAIVPNYVRVKYFEEMGAKIIYNKSDKMVIEENEKRMAKGFTKMDLHTEQARFESRNLKNMMSRMEKVVAALDRGLYREYGIGNESVLQKDEYSREKKREFDPGNVFDDVSSASSASPDVPKNDSETPTATPIASDTEEMSVKDKRLLNLAKAREARKKKHVNK